MIQPYIDCARRLRARGIRPDDIVEMVCEVGEGTVHRLWEPLAEKQRPPNGYAAKFCDALLHRRRRLVRGDVGLEPSPTRRWRSGGARAGRQGAATGRPANPYPNAYTGHIRARCATAASSRSASRTCAAARSEPLSRAELEAKFAANARSAAGARRGSSRA